MKWKLIPAVVLLAGLALLAACGKSDESKAPDAALAEPLDVPRMKIGMSSVEDYYEATGTVRAKTTTDVAANMMGRITSFPAREGDTVSRGQTLVEIDNRENQAQFQKATAGLKEARAALVEIDRSADAAAAAVKTAEANREIASKTFERIAQLYERRSASAQEFDEAQSRLKMADSELERARASVQTIVSKKKQIDARIEQAQADIAATKVYSGYSKIAAPVSGIVVKKFAEQGAIASPGQPLLSIEDNSQYRLEAAVEESKSNLAQVGKRVSVRIDALGGGDVTGIVSEILPSADAASRTYTVKIDLPANALLKSGLYGLARFPLAQKEAITVPQTAIIQRGQLTGVYAVSGDGIAQFRIVTTGATSDGLVEVLSGLSAGDEIVSADVQRVADGAKIR